MADLVFNIAKGAIAEKVRDGASAVGLLLLKTAEADATLRDYDTVAQILAGSNAEADFTNYARKTGISATVTVDDANDRVAVDTPDQTFAAAGGARNNSVVKAVFYYEDAAADSTRVPLTAHDCAFTTDGTDVTLAIADFHRAT